MTDIEKTEYRNSCKNLDSLPLYIRCRNKFAESQENVNIYSKRCDFEFEIANEVLIDRLKLLDKFVIEMHKMLVK